MKKTKLSKAITLSLLCGAVVIGIHQSAWAMTANEMLTNGTATLVDGTTNSYTIDVTGTISVSGGTTAAFSNNKFDITNGATLDVSGLSVYNPYITGNGDIIINNNVLPFSSSASGNSEIKIEGNSLTINNTSNQSGWSYWGAMVQSGTNKKITFNVKEDLIISSRYHGIGSEGGTNSNFIINANNISIKGSSGIFLNGSSDMGINAKGSVTITSGGHGITNNSTSGAVSVKANSINIKGWATGINAGWTSGTEKSSIILISSTSNTITNTYTGSANYGAITSSCGTVEVTANNGSNNITGSGWDGIDAGSNTSKNGQYLNKLATITLTAKGDNGSNIVNAANNGVQTFGPKVELNADKNNEVTASKYGLYTNATSKLDSEIILDAKNNNIISGAVAGIKSEIGNINVTATKDNTVTSEGDVLVATTEGNIELTNQETTTLTAGEGKKIIDATQGGAVYVNAEKASKKTVATGDVYAESLGNATITFDGEESFLLGKVTTVYTEDATESSSENTQITAKGIGKTFTDLTFNNGATWQMTADSNVSNLNMDAGIVDMTANAKGNARKLTVDKSASIKGATFKMDLKYIDNKAASYKADDSGSDYIFVNGGGQGGENNIVFDYSNGENLDKMNVNDKLYFASVINDNTMTFGDGGTIEVANKDALVNYLFAVKNDSLEDADYKDWYITPVGDKPVEEEEEESGQEQKPEEKPEQKPEEKPEENPELPLNNNATTPIEAYNAAQALWRDDDTLLKRLGELRYTNDEGGAWARVIGKKLEDNRKYGFNVHAKTAQVGYDRKDVMKDGSGTWRKGLAVGHTWGRTSFKEGHGHADATDVAVYGTNMRSKGHYLDLVARAGKISSDYDTAYEDHGEFDNWAAAVSAEYGRKKKLNDANWFIEPQAQLTYSYVWGDDYTTRKGFKIHQDNADSLVGRAGFVLSKEWENELKHPARAYAKAFVMHEFLDGGQSNFDAISGSYGGDFKDTWYVVGVGTNVDIGKQCTVYLDAEKNFKAKVNMPYRVEAGVRWEF